MLYLLLSILSTVALIVVFKYFSKFEVDTFQAIVSNYYVCVIIGYLLIDDKQTFIQSFQNVLPDWFYWAFGLGTFFIFAFYLIGKTTQIAGVSVVAIASKLSMVIPFLVSLFILKTVTEPLNFYNYLGLFLAIVSVVLTTYKEEKIKQKKSIAIVLLPISVFIISGISDAVINYINLKVLHQGEESHFTLGIFFSAMLVGTLAVIIGVVLGKINLKKKNILAGIALGIPNYFSIYFLIKALSSFQNNGAFLFPVNNIGIILVSALLGITFFGEKLSKLNIVGFILATISILLISYQGLFY